MSILLGLRSRCGEVIDRNGVRPPGSAFSNCASIFLAKDERAGDAHPFRCGGGGRCFVFAAPVPSTRTALPLKKITPSPLDGPGPSSCGTSLFDRPWPFGDSHSLSDSNSSMSDPLAGDASGVDGPTATGVPKCSSSPVSARP